MSLFTPVAPKFINLAGMFFFFLYLFRLEILFDLIDFGLCFVGSVNHIFIRLKTKLS